MYKKRFKRNISSQMIPGKIPDVSSLVSLPSDSEQFFQFEPAVVLDVILNEDHPQVNNSSLSSTSSPPKYDGERHKDEKDLSYIGRVKARMLYSEDGATTDSIRWASPLNAVTTEIPLINEIVHIVDIRGELYYTNRANHDNRLNYSGDFSAELYSSNGFGRPTEPEKPENAEPTEYDGPTINITYADTKSPKNFGVGGRYFSFNRKIRRLQRFEGDLIFESRFGQSIRFGSYDNDRDIDIGDTRYDDYTDVKGEHKFGNPCILIRNRQFSSDKGNFYSTILEDINIDGSSIQITSGLTTTKLELGQHFKKKIFSSDQKEEQGGYFPNGASTWKLPKLNGEQIVLFSNRILVGSRENETLLFSKKRFGIVSDDEFTVDSHKQIVMNTNQKTVINSPFIYLGEYDQTKEPAVLGETMIEWLYELGQWLKSHTHYYHHSHPDAGKAIKPKTQTSVQQAALENLIQKLPTTLSKRVFVTGGGYAPGKDGGNMGVNDDSVGKISNVPGGYYVDKPGSFSGKING